MQEKSLIGVIILNWNNWKDTVEAVQSVKASTYDKLRLYVVDNASTDDSCRKLLEFDPALRVIQSGANRGWAGGNNVGIRAALADGCDHVFLLNADATVLPDTFERLAEAVSTTGNAAAFGTLVRSASNPNWLEFAGSFIDPKNGHPRQLSVPSNSITFEGPVQETIAVKGCSLLMTGEGLRRLGLLHEDYFLNYDETDWCFAARNAGMKVCLVSTTSVLHQGAVSMAGASSPIYRYFITRNRLLFARRNLDKAGYKFAWRCALWELKSGLFLQQDAGGRSFRQRLWIVSSVLLAIRDYMLGRFGDCPAAIRAMTGKYKASLARTAQT